MSLKNLREIWEDILAGFIEAQLDFLEEMFLL